MRQKNHPKIRIFTTNALHESAHVDLPKEQAHYLVNVMRRKDGDSILVFNGKDGEWLAQITSSSKKHCSLQIIQQTKIQSTTPDIWLCFAPVKNAPIANMAQKATELGASLMQPVITKHTVVNKVNLERLEANIIEAAEQSERLNVPEVMEPVSLEKLLSSWDTSRKIIFCDEAGGGEPIITAISKLERSNKYAVLIGPEGGFSESEFAILRNRPYIIPVSMGPRILRADTAAIVALAAVFSILGDWDEKPGFKQ